MLVLVLMRHYDGIKCAEGLYSLENRYCVTVEECEAYGYRYHAYKPLLMCVYTYHYYTAAMQCKNHVCDCTDDYYLNFYVGLDK